METEVDELPTCRMSVHVTVRRGLRLRVAKLQIARTGYCLGRKKALRKKQRRYDGGSGDDDGSSLDG